MKKLWGGRFSKPTDKHVDDFNSSIRFDQRMYKQDIRGSIAHAKMLGKQNIIPQEDSDKIVCELKNIMEDIESGKIDFLIDAEDIHMNIEKILTDRIGDAGKRLHTGRSRNDQVALDIKMYIKDEAEQIRQLIIDLEKTILRLSKEHTDTIMPGYTHLQKAQPITFAHHLLAYFEMFKRDISRLDDCVDRMDLCPLGAGALAGTTYPLDREFTAKELGFRGVTLNSLDSVSDRDFAIEIMSVFSILMMHMSRFCEELILWSSNEFSFVEMDDAYSTGSSIMPQKKNPDVAELIRGKTGRVYGDLNTLLVAMKGLPLAYNKDMQEDKEPVFDSIDTVKLCLSVFSAMIDTMKINKDKMHFGAEGGFTNATDAADYLVKKGLPFREAHAVVGKMVAYALDCKKSLNDFTMDEFLACSDIFKDDIYDAISLKTCVNERKVIGGPAEETVKKAIAENEKYIEEICK